jgi:hypothetical protein
MTVLIGMGQVWGDGSWVEKIFGEKYRKSGDEK